jgi:hypothetical protein
MPVFASIPIHQCQSPIPHSMLQSKLGVHGNLLNMLLSFKTNRLFTHDSVFFNMFVDLLFLLMVHLKLDIYLGGIFYHTESHNTTKMYAGLTKHISWVHGARGPWIENP